MVYKVFYNDQLIGYLESESGKHRYSINKDMNAEMKASLSIFPELLENSDWRDPIPVLENRIRDARRFGITDNISQQTDSFRLEAVQ